MKLLTTSQRRLFLLALASLVSVTLIGCSGGSSDSSSTTTNAQPVYTAIIDAGSSGTRISFYKVIPGNGGYPQITLVDTNKFGDNGINDFILGTGFIKTNKWNAANGLSAGYAAPGCNMNVSPVVGGTVPNNSGDSTSVGACVLQPLLDSLSSRLTQYNITPSQVKVELFATAGMRTVAYKNGGTKSDEQIAAFYQTMKDYVSSTKGYTVGEFRTSNGNSEEGIWTWVNLNDQYYNIFGGNTTFSSSIQTPVGDFEVGGSSMQVAFPTNSAPSDAANIYAVNINGKSFNVYSKTFLGLGGDDARKFMRSAGYSSGGTFSYDGGVQCFSPGAQGSTDPNNTGTNEGSGIYLYYNTSLFPSSTSPVGNPSNNNSGSTWSPDILSGDFPLTWTTQVGAWDAARCAARYNMITDSVIALPRNANGTLNDGSSTTYANLRTAIASSSVNAFVGTDTFYYVAKDLGMDISTGFNPTAFAIQLNTTCSAPISGADLFSLGVCPNGSYMNDFLFRPSTGLFVGNGSKTFAGVVPNDDANGDTVLTWTRGYLLLKYAN